MNPIICYVYEYKSGRKYQNMGFLKIQSQYRKILVQMHLRGLALTNSEALEFCIFYKENDSAVFQKLMDLPVKNKSINMQVSISEDAFPGNRKMREYDGFFFRGPYGDTYVATWMNVPFNPDKIKEYTMPSDILADSEVPENPADSTDSEVPENPADSTDSSPKSPDVTESLDLENSEDRPASRCRKIVRSDLSVLPRRSWNIANNSFLLHGYYNFHHLILIETDDIFTLGVPGFYDKKEARAADLFGFPIFSKDYLKEVTLSNAERSDRDNFGYWCKTIQKLG